MGREGTWDRAGTPADIPPTANEVGMVRKNRDHGFLQRFLPVSTWAQDGFFKKTFRFCTMGVLCLVWEGRFAQELLQKGLSLRLRVLSVIPHSL